MMDPNETNQTLEEGKLEENETVVAETVTDGQPSEMEETLNTEETIEEAEATTYVMRDTREEVIARLKEIAEAGDVSDKAELDALKLNFYKLHRVANDAAFAAWVEAGNDAEAFVPERNTLEDEYKEAMGIIKQQRNALLEQQEAEREENLQKKLAIIERLKAICEGMIDTNAYNEVKQIQQEWKEIKNIPAGKVNEVWKSYQLYMEKFYDLLKLNNEFREYDFKKNLEIKTRLCEEAEKLAEETDVVSAFHQLQKLHQEYRETGPVAKDLREELWVRFKNASTEVNKRHQSHFEAIKEAEQNNLDQKTVICEIVEGMDLDQLTGFAQWEEKTKEVLALQAKWKTIGYAPQKMNVKIFERFRQACDNFFTRKAEYFKQYKENMAENLEKKIALCEQAEALKESTDWKETADKLTKLQKEWKTIGAVPHKQSDVVWKRFIAACDYFFEQKGKATSSQRSVEVENLAKKKDIIARLTAFNTDEVVDGAEREVRALMQEWNKVGHVPFKEKDKIYKEYRAVVDALFDKFNITASQKNLNKFRSNLNNGGGNSLAREREKLMRSYEMKKNEIQTYENNIGFLTSSSKKGNSLVAEMNRKIEKLKADLQLIVDKIKVIDEQEEA
ncbi:MAG: DUF349 domain-containing protein [Bacteroidaceae bacterium]|nr:DUF349 domain-containing protein [Bacteroidaceae bacterium]